MIQISENSIEFNDNSKRLRFLRLGASSCWLLFTVINSIRFFNDPELKYLMLSLASMVACILLGFPMLKETTAQTIAIEDISKVVLKKFPTHKIHGRIVTKRKKNRPFSVNKKDFTDNGLIEFFRKHNIYVQEG